MLKTAPPHRISPSLEPSSASSGHRRLAPWTALGATLLSSTTAFAQEAATTVEATTTTTTTTTTTEPVAPAEPPPPEEQPTTVVTTKPAEPATPPESAEAAEAVGAKESDPLELKPKLNVGMGIRAGTALIFDDASAGGPALRLDDGVGQLYNIRPYFSGQLTDAIGFTGNFETTQSGLAVLDAIVQVKVADEFQVWFGQHIPAMERNNTNGPFYNNGWNLPIVVQTLPFDIAGRDRGVTAWGLVAGGLLKYHLSVVDLAAPVATAAAPGVTATQGAGIGSARYAARVTVNLLDPENYYYTSGTYYGEQDTLAIGAVIHGQKGVDGPGGADLDNDLLAFTADVLFEKNLGKGGTITFEGGYWNFEATGAAYVPNQGTADLGVGAVGPLGATSYLASVSWLTPEKIGYGKLQPLAKLQVGDYAATAVALDLGLGYIIDGFNHRWFLNFRHQDNGGGASSIDMLQIGAQLQL